jgi:type I restriction enzyme R subunit
MAKLTPLVRLRYEDSIPEAVADLGDPLAISDIFSGFQKFLYSTEA